MATPLPVSLPSGPFSRDDRFVVMDNDLDIPTLSPADAREKDRQAALDALDLLGGPRLHDLDALCDIAAATFAAPVTFLSLIDRDMQIIRAAKNVNVAETPRALSICNYTIAQNDVLVVPDLLADDRFRDNPLSTRRIRFYAGAPLRYENRFNLGSLCVLDIKPRHFSERDRELLAEFARIAVGLLHERVLARETERQREQLEQAARELYRKHRIMSQTERLAQIGGWEIETDGQGPTLSDEVYRMAGLPIGMPVNQDEMTAFLADGSRAVVEERMQRLARTGEAFDIEVEASSVRGDTGWVRITGERETVAGRSTRLFGVVQDITQRRAEQHRLWHMANHDPLTGLPNRAYFMERFQAAIALAQHQGTGLALMFVDLDNFKDINDTLGHSSGDAYLVEVSRRIQAQLRPEDMVGRLGGDEFAILVTSVADAGQVGAIARRILTLFHTPFTETALRVSPSASLGVAIYPEDGRTPRELMQNADIALYAAKASGRANARFYEPGNREALERRLDEVAAFRRALAEGQIAIHYQPQVRLSDGALHGFEALTRWRRPEGGYRPAGEFADVFDDPESMIALGAFVREQVCADLARWRAAGLDPCKVSINASACELRTGDYVDACLAALGKAGLPAELLEIEITESVAFGHQNEGFEDIFERLERNGIRIALDDFGTGYASLLHLKRYAIDQLKIDRTFVTNLLDDSDDAAIVRAIVGLAGTLGINAVAEGVETEAQRQWLVEIGCPYAQGFLFSPAVPGEAVEAMLARRCAGRLAWPWSGA